MFRGIVGAALTAMAVSGAAAGPYAGKTVKAVEVRGNKQTSSGTIKEQIKVRKGDPFSEAAVNADIQRLYGMNAFSDVSVDVSEIPGGVKVTFLVAEKPTIKRVEFKGNKKWGGGTLRSEITTKERSPYDARKVSEDVEKLLEKYRDKGYADVAVEPFTSADPASGQVLLTFFITEGHRIRIKEIALEGVHAFPVKKVLKKMDTGRKDVYREEKFRKDLDKVRQFYKDNGFMEMTISTPTLSYDPGRTWMFLSLLVAEGPRYTVSTMTWSGNTVFTDEQIRKEVEIRPGRLYKQEDYERTLERIRSKYADKGYLRMQAEPELDKDPVKGMVGIHLRFMEGGLVYVDRISIEGNQVTREFVIRRELLVKEGDPFDAGKVRRSQEKIFNLGFFEDVKIDVNQTRAVDKADLIFEVIEQRTGTASLGAGFSSQDKLIGSFSISQTNLFGRAQRVDLTLEFGARRNSYQVSFTEPWLFGHHLLFGVDLFNTTRRRVFTGNAFYTERRLGGGVRIGKPLSDIWMLNVGYTFERVRLFDFDSAIPDEFRVDTSSDTSTLNTSLVRDTRDNVFDPSRGGRLSLGATLAGGPLLGDINFVRENLSVSWFWPVVWRVVFGVNWTGASVREFDGSRDVPLQERFFVGGAETVRGYDFRGQIGPSNGGKWMTVANAELKFPLVSERGRTILQWAFFADIGGAWRDADEITWKVGEQELSLKSGAGGGIRFKTPVFPIRLDWGYGFNHRAGEDKSQFYFTIGQVF